MTTVLFDSFDAPVLDTSVWQPFATGNGTVNVGSGAAEISSDSSRERTGIVSPPSSTDRFEFARPLQPVAGNELTINVVATGSFLVGTNRASLKCSTGGSGSRCQTIENGGPGIGPTAAYIRSVSNEFRFAWTAAGVQSYLNGTFVHITDNLPYAIVVENFDPSQLLLVEDVTLTSLGGPSVDSDGDGIPDDSEIASGGNPANADNDFDGSNDNEEVSLGTDPSIADTDGDGFNDGYEIASLTDGTNALSIPQVLLEDDFSDGQVDWTTFVFGGTGNVAEMGGKMELDLDTPGGRIGAISPVIFAGIPGTVLRTTFHPSISFSIALAGTSTLTVKCSKSGSVFVCSTLDNGISTGATGSFFPDQLNYVDFVETATGVQWYVNGRLVVMTSGLASNFQIIYENFDASVPLQVEHVQVTQPPLNSAPNLSVDSNAVTVDEGDVATNSGTFDDIDTSDNVTISASAGTITFQDVGNVGSWSWEFDSSDGPSESQLVTITADDGNGGTAQTTFMLTVNNVPPSVTSLVVPTVPIDIGTQGGNTVDAVFNDPAGTSDNSYTCEFDMDYDGMTFAADETVSGVFYNTCSASLGYTEPGVYTVKVIVTDKDGDSGMAVADEFVVVYDPDGGFVTGGGWIDSPTGACPVFCDDATGKANFGFVSKYHNGASVPTGQTEFNFSAGDLNFHSTSYDWLVIAGKKAMYKGEGKVNGNAGFTFQLNAIDGDLTGGDGVDKFRIKIKESGGGVIYDNQMGAGDNDDPTTAIGGGQIKIHKQANLTVKADSNFGSVGVMLTQAMLDAAVTDAIAYWLEQEVASHQLSALNQVEISISELVGRTVGTTSVTSNSIRIDRDAGGFGWASVPGRDGVDLLSAVTHEFGHMLGLDHDVLGSTLEVGQRRLPVLAMPGDANHDGVFDRFDLIELLQDGKYLSGETADWRQGDFNGDGQFDQQDIVQSLQHAKYITEQHVTDELFGQLGS